MESKTDGINPQNSDMSLLTHRSRSALHRTIQYCSGLLVMCVVLVCVLTLVTHNGARSAHRVTHRKVVARSESVLIRSVGVEERGDIFISVKTTKKFHRERLAVILKTWYTLDPLNIFFFTDAGDPSLLIGDHLVSTSCPSDHSRQALSCKMQAEFNFFLTTNSRWFCHFDDDQYVNVVGLKRKLAEFPADLPWYLGKPSIQTPLQILDKQHPDQKKIRFWFGTGGAGFCLSRPLAEQMAELAGAEEFINTAERMRLPDDVTMGYIVEMLAGVPLTKLDEFHSHLEPLRLVSDLENQISFSYSAYGEERNIVEVDGLREEEDPTRFMSIHCKLFPATSWCPTTN